MNIPSTLPITFFPLGDLEMEAAASIPGPKTVIYSSTDPKYKTPTKKGGMPAFVTHKHGLQIIACRNIRTNIKMSLMMALRMSNDSPVKNTGYAGGGYIWDKDPRSRLATEEELKLGAPERIAIFDYKAKPGTPYAWKNSDEVRVLYVNSYATLETLRDAAHELLDEKLVELRADMPFGILNCPIGTWPEQLEKIRKLIKDNQFTTIVINAFEFIAMSQRQKDAIALELMKWQRELAVTIVIFTQEVRKNMHAGWLGRGPLGKLQAMADSVVVLPDDCEIDEEEDWTEGAGGAESAECHSEPDEESHGMIDKEGFNYPAIESTSNEASDQPVASEAVREYQFLRD